MNDWMCRSSVGRQLPSRSRQGARPRSSRRSRSSIAISTSTATASRSARCRACIPRGVLHARLGPQQVRRLHRGRGRVPGGARSPARKIQGATRAVPRRDHRPRRARRWGIVTVGGCHAACVEALDLLAKDGIALDYMRVRGFPFGDEVREVPRAHDVNFVVEQNRDAQLRSLLMLETGGADREAATRSATTRASR